jgi:Cu-Zn family superoxide dismutase
MKKIGMTFVCVLLAACGGSSSQPREPAAPQAQTMPAADQATETSETEGAVYAAPGPAPEVAPVEPPAPEPAVVAPLVARAELKSVKDDSPMGTVTFEQGADGQITINGQFNGLKKKGVHAFYVHENGDCSNKGKNVGKHLDPTKAKHGPPASSQRHAGDFGNLTADEAGVATFSMTTDSVTMEADRPDSVLNRAVVIHAKKDDKKGSGGAAIACGVIQLVAE